MQEETNVNEIDTTVLTALNNIVSAQERTLTLLNDFEERINKKIEDAKEIEEQKYVDVTITSTQKDKERIAKAKVDYMLARDKATINPETVDILRTITGDVPVSQYISNEIFDYITSVAGITNAVSRLGVGGELKFWLESSTQEPIWTGGGVQNDTSVVTESLNFTNYELIRSVIIPKLLLTNTISDTLPFIYRTIANSMRLKLEDTIIGEGTTAPANTPAGIIHSAHNLTTTVAELTRKEILKAMVMLDNSVYGNLSLITSKEEYIVNLFDERVSTTNPTVLNLNNANTTVTPPFNYLGMPVYYSRKLQPVAAAASGDVVAIIGDLSAYLLNIPYGLEVSESDHFKFTENQKAIKGVLQAGGHVIRKNNILVIKKA